MKIVKVATTTKADFVEQNQQSIKKLIPDLTKLKHQGINYNACLSAEKKLSKQIFLTQMKTGKIYMIHPRSNYFRSNSKQVDLKHQPHKNCFT
jgi:hypothetical protein